MALLFNVREFQFADESAFCENATSPASNTWTTRIPVISGTVTLEQPLMDDASVQSRRDQTRPGYLGVRTASLEFTCYIPGHNTATTGALTETWFGQLMGDGIGGSNWAQVGSTVGTATSTTAFTLASGSLIRGGACRVGTIDDGRGNGQYYSVSAMSGSNVTLLNALEANSSVGDTVYACGLLYPDFDATVVSKRFLVGWTETGAQYHLMGGHLESLSMTFALGELPQATFRYRFAYWDRAAVTIPSVLTLENCNTQPCSGGSVFLQDYGSSTRNYVTPSRIELAFDMPLVDKPGQNHLAAYQVISGYERLRFIPTITLTIPWSTAFEAGYRTDGSNTTFKHIIVTTSAGNGSRAHGFALLKAYPISPHPVPVDENGLLYQQISFRGAEVDAESTDITKSNFRFFVG